MDMGMPARSAGALPRAAVARHDARAQRAPKRFSDNDKRRPRPDNRLAMRPRGLFLRGLDCFRASPPYAPAPEFKNSSWR